MPEHAAAFAGDTKTTPIHRVVGSSAIVDEMIVEFTHDQEVRPLSLFLPLSDRMGMALLLLAFANKRLALRSLSCFLESRLLTGGCLSR